jgi:carbon monoxide dehydrogenase subunit G
LLARIRLMDWAKRIVLTFVAIVLLVAIILLLIGQRPGAARNYAVIEINRPASQVFPWLIEPGKMKQWISGLTEATQLTPGPVAVGTKFRDVMVLDDQKTVMKAEITAFEPDKTITLNLDSDGFTDQIRYNLTEQNGKTRLEYSGLANYKILFAKLMEPVITPAVQKKLEEDIVKLKTQVESQ